MPQAETKPRTIGQQETNMILDKTATRQAGARRVGSVALRASGRRD